MKEQREEIESVRHTGDRLLKSCSLQVMRSPLPLGRLFLTRVKAFCLPKQEQLVVLPSPASFQLSVLVEGKGTLCLDLE